MLEENKNFKNSVKDISPISTGYQTQDSVPNGQDFISYTKTNKLITALYMVTDILDNGEPLKNKLRSLGTDIVSDISSISGYKDLSNFISQKVSAIMSLLDIASAMNLISEMNCNILKKEFIELKQSVEESSHNLNIFKGNINLSEFLKDETFLESKHENNFSNNNVNKNLNNSKGHMTNIGVQKGSTLLKALKDIKEPKIFKRTNVSSKTNFNNLKRERREIIIKIIKDNNNATITDIKNRATGVLVSCGEKTLQRELVSMVQDGVLKKMGEKRWSKYFL